MPAVLDTNVLLVANGSHEGVSPACQAECVQRLLAHQQNGVTVIDDSYRILSEYLRKTQPNQPKGVGDAFLKWLLQNQRNPARVHCVNVIETAPDIYAARDRLSRELSEPHRAAARLPRCRQGAFAR